jgi:hypothetical protein
MPAAKAAVIFGGGLIVEQRIMCVHAHNRALLLYSWFWVGFIRSLAVFLLLR